MPTYVNPATGQTVPAANVQDLPGAPDGGVLVQVATSAAPGVRLENSNRPSRGITKEGRLLANFGLLNYEPGDTIVQQQHQVQAPVGFVVKVPDGQTYTPALATPPFAGALEVAMRGLRPVLGGA